MNKETINDISISYKNAHRITFAVDLKRNVDFWIFKYDSLGLEGVYKNEVKNDYAIVFSSPLRELDGRNVFPTIMVNSKGEIQTIIETKSNYLLNSVYKSIVVNKGIMKIIGYGLINNERLKEEIYTAINFLIKKSSDEEKPLINFLCRFNDNPQYNIPIIAKSSSEVFVKAVILAEKVLDVESISICKTKNSDL